jgi:hypothetical protein
VAIPVMGAVADHVVETHWETCYSGLDVSVEPMLCGNMLTCAPLTLWEGFQPFSS